MEMKRMLRYTVSGKKPKLTERPYLKKCLKKAAIQNCLLHGYIQGNKTTDNMDELPLGKGMKW